MMHRPSLRRLSAEDGSAFIIALLVIVILSFLGLSLTVVTETEMMLGATEVITDSTTFAAEAGFGAAIAQVILSHSPAEEYVVIPAPPEENRDAVPGFTLGYAVHTTNLFPVIRAHAPYSGANEGADQQFFSYSLFSGSVARRVAWTDTETTPFEDSVGADGIRALRAGTAVQSEEILWSTILSTPLREDIFAGKDLKIAFKKPSDKVLREIPTAAPPPPPPPPP